MPENQALEGRNSVPRDTRMPQSFGCLNYHIIFSTKQRQPLLTANISNDLFQYIGGILRANNGVLLSAGRMPDHIHLLGSLSREMSVAEAVRLIKTNSLSWMHETIPDQQEFAWQAGYGAFTVSYSNIGDVREYLAKQAEHHRVRTFKEEFLEFLRKHDLSFDERYLWD